MMFHEINAVTFGILDMARSLGFYTSLGFEVRYGGPSEPFTSLRVGSSNFINLQLVDEPPGQSWGRVIIHVEDVDVVHDRVVAAGYRPEMAPSDAPWGERYFHVRDPDGHELSFARLLPERS